MVFGQRVSGKEANDYCNRNGNSDFKTSIKVNFFTLV